MGRRNLEIVLNSAESLRRKGSSELKVYAKAYLSYKPKLVQFTPEDPHGGVNPRWNHSFCFILKSRKTSNEFLNIVLYDICASGKEAPVVGHVQIPLETFRDENKEPTPPRNLSRSIPEGGTLHLSYNLGKYDNRIKAVSKKITQKVVGFAADTALAVGIEKLAEKLTE